ncbi:MAG TPA: hypothetical protein VHJ20_19985 [Polyangia bacterium]|nr:hypothetical protein [Polyangia bacterium]
MRWIWVVAAVLVGCGSSSSPAAPDGATSDAGADVGGVTITDLSGFYRVTSDQEGACGATSASTLSGAYAFLDREQSLFVWRVCGEPARDACTGTLTYDFDTPIAGGMRAAGGVAFFSDGCTLTWEQADATLAGDELHVHLVRNRIVEQIAEDACTLDAARALTGPCVYQVDLVATRVSATDGGAD